MSRRLRIALLAALAVTSGCTFNLWRGPFGRREDVVRLVRERPVTVAVREEDGAPVLELGIAPQAADRRLRHVELRAVTAGRTAARLLAGEDGLTVSRLTVELAGRDAERLDLVLVRLFGERGREDPGASPFAGELVFESDAPEVGGPRRFHHLSQWRGAFVVGAPEQPGRALPVRLETEVRRARGSPLVLDVGARLLLTPLTVALDLVTAGLLSELASDDETVAAVYDEERDAWFWDTVPKDPGRARR